MSTVALAVRDSSTMLRRQLKHIRRYPSMTVMLAGMPIVFMLLFVYVLGGTLGAGLGGDRGDYLEYVVPGILMMTVAAVGTATAVSVATDMTEGIVARFRTMAIARVSVLTGHVLGSVLQALLAVIVVGAVAVAIGFRPQADPLAWLGALGVMAMASFAVTWVSVGLGLVSKSIETASNLPTPLYVLPFLGSAFVPADSMPPGLREFAEYQPFTPIIETLRGLLVGGATAGSALAAAGWCAALALAGYLWSRRLYAR